jgi:hypothetical protein
MGLPAEESMIVTREECSDKVWALFEHYTNRIRALDNELTEAYKRLCRYEGHLPIRNSDGHAWCELCGQKLT